MKEKREGKERARQESMRESNRINEWSLRACKVERKGREGNR